MLKMHLMILIIIIFSINIVLLSNLSEAKQFGGVHWSWPSVD